VFGVEAQQYCRCNETMIDRRWWWCEPLVPTQPNTSWKAMAAALTNWRMLMQKRTLEGYIKLLFESGFEYNNGAWKAISEGAE
jgi:hypothetical protein